MTVDKDQVRKETATRQARLSGELGSWPVRGGSTRKGYLFQASSI